MVPVMKTAEDDIVELLDYAWARLRKRMDGLTDQEWSWRPVVADERITVRWRLAHITEFLSEERNWTWLGVAPSRATTATGDVQCAQDALTDLAAAYAAFRDLRTVEAVDLTAPIGPPAGRYGSATRRSFVLHIADELIHHGAEAALIRDLYASRGC
jgi:hypothetical protein